MTVLQSVNRVNWAFRCINNSSVSLYGDSAAIFFEKTLSLVIPTSTFDPVTGR